MVELRIDDVVRADIAKMCATASQFPLSFSTFTKLSKLKPEIRKRQLPSRAHREVLIPFGYKVGFEIAEVRPERPCRHLLVLTDDRMPEPVAVARIMQEFGFRYSLRDVMTWVEKPFTVHVVEPLDV